MENLLEDLAAQTIADLGIPIPVSAFSIARNLGLSTRAAPIETAFFLPCLQTIAFAEATQEQRQHALVARRCAEFLLEIHELPRTRASVGRFGASLLVPWPALSKDVQEVGLDLEELRRRHPNASTTLLAGRVAELLGGGMGVWKDGELAWTRGFSNARPPSAAVFSLVSATSRLGCSAGTEQIYAVPVGGGYVVAIEVPSRVRESS